MEQLNKDEHAQTSKEQRQRRSRGRLGVAASILLAIGLSVAWFIWAPDIMGRARSTITAVELLRALGSVMVGFVCLHAFILLWL
jgi:hypothetical protein